MIRSYLIQKRIEYVVRSLGHIANNVTKKDGFSIKATVKSVCFVAELVTLITMLTNVVKGYIDWLCPEPNVIENPRAGHLLLEHKA